MWCEVRELGLGSAMVAVTADVGLWSGREGTTRSEK
jgi:hypothetical protein